MLLGMLLLCAGSCSQVSKGFAVSMLSLWAQQSARQLLLRLLAAERSKGAHLGSSLEGKDARLHDLDATVGPVRRAAQLMQVAAFESGGNKCSCLVVAASAQWMPTGVHTALPCNTLLV
jgi:hypothetical protein